MEDKKYELLKDDYKEVFGIKLYRIRALKDFGDVKKGDVGGYIEKEENLSQKNTCWVYKEAKVWGEARVYGEAIVCGKVTVYGEARICEEAAIYGEAEICGNAKIKSFQDYIVFKNNWSSGRYFTWTRNNDMWKVGCFYGTSKELIEQAYKDSKLSGDMYKMYVEFVEKIKERLKEEEKIENRTL